MLIKFKQRQFCNQQLRVNWWIFSDESNKSMRGLFCFIYIINELSTIFIEGFFDNADLYFFEGLLFHQNVCILICKSFEGFNDHFVDLFFAVEKGKYKESCFCLKLFWNVLLQCEIWTKFPFYKLVKQLRSDNRKDRFPQGLGWNKDLVNFSKCIQSSEEVKSNLYIFKVHILVQSSFLKNQHKQHSTNFTQWKDKFLFQIEKSKNSEWWHGDIMNNNEPWVRWDVNILSFETEFHFTDDVDDDMNE